MDEDTKPESTPGAAQALPDRSPRLPPPETEIDEHNPVAALLKAPHTLATAFAENRDLLRTGTIFLLCALAFHSAFGLAVGLFGGWQVALMDAVKAPLIALCALLLCYPSLYVFACVGGAPLSIAQVFALGSSCLAMVGLLLVGLAPVAWLFAVSTESLSFVVLLALAVWVVAVAFAASYVNKLESHELFARPAGIRLWFFIFLLVALQMTTAMRPILVKPGTGWWTAKKEFFLVHFSSCFEKGR